MEVVSHGPRTVGQEESRDETHRGQRLGPPESNPRHDDHADDHEHEWRADQDQDPGRESGHEEIAQVSATVSAEEQNERRGAGERDDGFGQVVTVDVRVRRVHNPGEQRRNDGNGWCAEPQRGVRQQKRRKPDAQHIEHEDRFGLRPDRVHDTEHERDDGTFPKRRRAEERSPDVPGSPNAPCKLTPSVEIEGERAGQLNGPRLITTIGEADERQRQCNAPVVRGSRGLDHRPVVATWGAGAAGLVTIATNDDPIFDCPRSVRPTSCRSSQSSARRPGQGGNFR